MSECDFLDLCEQVRASSDRQSLIKISGHSGLQVCHFTALKDFCFKLENLLNEFSPVELVLICR